MSKKRVSIKAPRADTRFETNAARVEHVEELEAELSTVFGTRPAAEWVEKFRTLGIPVGPINTVAESFVTAAQLGLDPITTFDGGDGPFRSVRSPMRMSATPPMVRRRPPKLDEHGDEIRREV